MTLELNDLSGSFNLTLEIKVKFDKFKWVRETNFYEKLNGAFILIPKSNLISSIGLDALSPT